MESSNKDKLDLKTIGGYAAGILIFMSAMRLLLETQEFGIPIMDFISFSNMIVYVLDILYGTTIFIIISCLIILFRGKIDECIIEKRKKDSWGLRKWPLFCMLLTSGIVVFLIYKLVPTTYCLGMCLKFIVFVGIGFTGIWFKYCCDIREYNFLLTILIFVFVFLSTKIVISYENYLYNSKQPVPTTIIFKEHDKTPFTSGSGRRFVTATMDFAFTYDSTKKSYTAYPMAEIFSIENRGK
jgi:hypothetical protein